MAEDNAPCAELVEQRLKARTRKTRIVELEAQLAKTEEDRNFWASDALEEVTRVWAAKDNTDRWRRYAEHWRGRVRGASEAVRAAMERERAAWAAWSVVVESLRKEREGAGAERERLASTVVESRKLLGGIGPDAPPLTEQVRQIVAERDALIRLLCDLTPGGSEFVGHPDRCAKYIRQEIHEHLNSALKATMRAHDAEAERDRLSNYFSVEWERELKRRQAAEAERDRLTKIVSSMYAALGADLESGDDPAAEVARCIREREQTLKATVARCVDEMEICAGYLERGGEDKSSQEDARIAAGIRAAFAGISAGKELSNG